MEGVGALVEGRKVEIGDQVVASMEAAPAERACTLSST